MEKYVKFKDACVKNRANEALPGNLLTWETCSSYAPAPALFFQSIAFQEALIFEKRTSIISCSISSFNKGLFIYL